jgi:hypothetical protein
MPEQLVKLSSQSDPAQRDSDTLTDIALTQLSGPSDAHSIKIDIVPGAAFQFRWSPNLSLPFRPGDFSYPSISVVRRALWLLQRLSGIVRRQRPVTNIRGSWMHTLVGSIGYPVRLSALQRVCVLL